MRPPLDALIRIAENGELGPGRLTGFDEQGRAQVRLLWTPTDVTVDAVNGIERYELFPGTPISLKSGGKGGGKHAVVIARPDTAKAGHWTYRADVAGEGVKKASSVTVSEVDIEPLPPLSSEPLDHLRALAWGSPDKFIGRWKLRLIESRYVGDSGGIPPLIGARVNPMGHQIYAVRRVLWDRVPRFVLADEVGLGKTVEAGLVVQALKAWKPQLRVLILAPGSMARQWQTELYLRFGALASSYIDGTIWTSVSGNERKRLLARQHLIVTTTLLQAVPAVREGLKAGQWDILVIDEAHQFPPGSPIYDFFHEMATQVDGLLALSATPSKREIASLSGLLSLVSPDIYKPHDSAGLGRRVSKQRAIWDRLSITRKFVDAAKTEGKALDSEDLAYLASEWGQLIPEDPVVEGLLSKIRKGDATAIEQLIAYVQEFHRLDHRIIRTRRSTLQSQRKHWSERKLSEVRYQPCNAEALVANHFEVLPDVRTDSGNARALRGLYFRMASETPGQLARFLEARRDALEGGVTEKEDDLLGLLCGDPSPADEAAIIASLVMCAPSLIDERRWLDTAIGLAEQWIAQEPICGKISAIAEWLETYLATSETTQVLVFAQDREVVEEIRNTLSKAFPALPVRAFHHGMEEAALAKVALDFQRNRSCRILVSDELGGEGRNFQNANAVVHFDVPWSVARIEQRIGRLDRVGRGADRPVLSVVCRGPMTMESALLQVHINAFRVYTRSVGGLEYALPKLQRSVVESLCQGADALTALRSEIEASINRELSEVDEAFDLSLDASKLQLRDAQELAQILEEPADYHAEGVTMAKWANNIGILSQKRGKTWEFQWDADVLQRPIVGLPEKHLVEGTFDRDRALKDESEQFFGPGHPFVDAILRDLGSSGEGRATVLGTQLGDAYVGRWFALILGRCRSSEQPLFGKEVSGGLRLRASRFSWPQMQPVIVELYPGRQLAAAPLDDAHLTAMFRGPNTISAPYKPIPANLLGESIDTAELWASLEKAVEVARQRIVEFRRGIPEAAASSLKEDLAPEVGFLHWQKANASAKLKKRIDEELAARAAIVRSLEGEDVDVDAMAILIGVK